MIVSFNDSDTESLAGGTRVKRLAKIEVVARRKLRQLEIATSLEDLRIPPGNRLEGLKGDRAGQHSIRINDRFRVCFRWRGDSAFDVEITDYRQGGGAHGKAGTGIAGRNPLWRIPQSHGNYKISPR